MMHGKYMGTLRGHRGSMSGKQIDIVNLAIVGSHAVNGVATEVTLI